MYSVTDQQQKGLEVLRGNVGVILLAVLYFLSQYVFNGASDKLAKLETLTHQQNTQLALLTQTVDSLKQQTIDNYGLADAKRDQTVIKMQLSELDKRLSKVEVSR